MDGDWWLTPRLGRFTPGNDTVLVQEAGKVSGSLWTVGGSNLALPVFDPLTVQPLASGYTD